MATLANLADRLRSEIGDIGRSFEETFVGDGDTKRFQLTNAPVLGSSLIVKVNGTNVSNTSMVEERTGMLILANTPAADATIVVSGTAYKYFSQLEISEYINTAFLEHTYNSRDLNGSKLTVTTLPSIDEYPLVLLASTMALYTLATDASFDIDIISPDGVSIPRSERFRQLNEIVNVRKEQYRELCNLLGIGMYKIDVFTFRRISRLTNRYVPVYKPMEIDDNSLPQRIQLPVPEYGDQTPQDDVIYRDLSMYSGDDFTVSLKFSMDLTSYTPKAEIRLFPTGGRAQVGPVIVGTFTITKIQSPGQLLYDTLKLELPGSVTADLPKTAYYDVQLTDSNGKVRTYIKGKVFTESQVTL